MSSVRSFAKKYFSAMTEDTFCRISAFLFPILMCYVFLGIFVAQFNRDEFEAVHTAWKMLQGETIFKDFFQHHHQFFYYSIMPPIYFFGETDTTLYAIRTVMFGICVSLYGVVFYCTRRYFSSGSAWIALFLMVGLPILPCGFQIRPDGLMVLLALIGVVLLFRFLEKKEERYLIMSGLSLACSFLVLHKINLLFLALAFLCIYLVAVASMSVKDLCRYALYGLLPILLYAGYLVYNGLWQQYWHCNWLFNMYQPAASNAWAHVAPLYTQSILTIAFFLLGLCFYSKTAFQKYIVYCACALLILTMTVVKVPWIQYYMLPFCFVVMVAGGAMSEIFGQNYTQVLIILVLHFSQAYLGGGHVLVRHGFKQSPQMERLHYILDNTDKDDYVYDGVAENNLFRKDIHFFWFDGGMQLDSEAFKIVYTKIFNNTYDVYKAIEEKKPKIITTAYLDALHPVIKTNYKKSDQFSGLMVRSAV